MCSRDWWSWESCLLLESSINSQHGSLREFWPVFSFSGIVMTHVSTATLPRCIICIVGLILVRNMCTVQSSGHLKFWMRAVTKLDGTNSNGWLRPCPHDTFPNRARSIATSSRPVARVHTGATGTLVPVSRDHLATWNERARSIAIGCALSPLSCGRSTGALEIIWRDKHTPLRPN